MTACQSHRAAQSVTARRDDRATQLGPASQDSRAAQSVTASPASAAIRASPASRDRRAAQRSAASQWQESNPCIASEPPPQSSPDNSSEPIHSKQSGQEQRASSVE